MTLWFVARAAGFVALLFATVTVALGAGGTASRRETRVVAQLVHRSAAVIALAMLALHAVLLVTDSYVDVSVPGALVPFLAGYRGLAVGLGTLATYAFLVVSATGALRGRLASSARAAAAWRAIHLSAYAAWALAMGHGILAGTDTLTAWGLGLYGGCGAVVGVAVAVRLLPSARRRRTLVPGPRRQRPRPAPFPHTTTRRLEVGR